MALRDLVAQKSALTEDSIERIVQEYVRYDADRREIAFTPEFARLSNKAKVLVYFVALLGWPFVVDEAMPTEAKPADIEQELGIPGGTLRPLLKELKERHLLYAKGGSYSVRMASFDAIEKELTTRSIALARPGSVSNKSKRKAANGEAGSDRKAGEKGRSTKAPLAGSKEITLKFNRWVKDGFFNSGRTLGEVQARFHKEAIIIPQTSIPKYLLRAIRDERLSRDKQEVDGKERWVYRTKS